MVVKLNENRIIIKAVLLSILLLFLLTLWCYDNSLKIKQKNISKDDIICIPIYIPIVFFTVYWLVEYNESMQHHEQNILPYDIGRDVTVISKPTVVPNREPPPLW